ncbi:hypothetical protein [Vannielia litorea]|uniref:Uncharacterized protein n=1 Tax=Vannielia litorea TaxID=1217970 RepID=A0A1N6GEM5_9RHOB|nr:hypothetical protein [Vannielia litorea]SIO05936.1 hypothetical protein SAMN05444002_2421 [Vannielia litorea]
MMLRASLIALTLACAAPAHAAGEMPPLRAMEMSRTLFAAGVEARDPLLMATAAQLRKGVSIEAVERAGSDGEALAGEAPLSWEAMLDAAREAAGEDEAMLSVIEDIRTAGTKGVSTGPVYSISRLAARKTDTYPPLPYDGGEYAEVYVEGGGDSDLNLYVYDAKGRLVCSDTDKSDVAYCGWRPATSEAFTVKVENKGAGTNRYSLMTN